MARIIRIGGSFAIVLVAYWAYALVAVPLIEPSADRASSERLSEAELKERAEMAKERWRKDLAGLFPPGSWELDDPKILEIDQVKLLLEDYTRLDDGKKVEIRPCTMIFMPDGRVGGADRRQGRTIILEAPQGAVLEFDRPVDLRRAQIGRLVSGELKGQIKIRSDGRSPGPEDDLLVVTRDVDLNEERIWIPHAVDFRLGRSYGRGRQMWIELLNAQGEEETGERGLNVDGIEWVEVTRLEQLHLDFSRQRFTAGDQKTEAAEALPSKSGLDSSLPVEITCRGPFRFDLIRQVATFEEQVDVLRVHPEGPVDQLNCEKLSVFFARPRATTPAQAKDPPGEKEVERSSPLDLHPRRIEATGEPVVVRAPNQQVDARGERLEYDFETGLIKLDRLREDSSEEVFLKQGQNEIHARWLQYQLAESGRLGQVMAEGPGWLRVERAESSVGSLEAGAGNGSTLAPRPSPLTPHASPFTARWGRLLHLRPHEGQPVISLTGNAELEYGRLGRLTAAEIHFYLFELPPEGPNDRVQVRPDRMVALGQVVLDSPQLSGTVQELRVWFEQAESRELTVESPELRVERPEAGRGNRSTLAPHPSPLTPRRSPLAPSSPTEPPQHFEIVGRLLQAKVLIEEKNSELDELTVEGDVRLTETRAAQPGELPVVVRGELIRVIHASRPHREVTVTGNPARFEGRGLTLSGLDPGSSIQLDGGTNRLGIDAPGWMELPLDRDLDGRPLDNPGRLRVQWQRQMTFDGLTARFEGSVVAGSRQPPPRGYPVARRQETDLHTEMLDVSFARPVRFDEFEGRHAQPEVERIVCHGGTVLKNRSFDERGQLSRDETHVADVNINLTSGKTVAGGPGRMTTVRRGSPELLASRVESPELRVESPELRVEGSGLRVQSPEAGGGNRSTLAPHPSPLAPRPSPLTPHPSSGPDENRLTCLNVRFQGTLEGNLHDREMTFHDQVRTAYGPVGSWQAALDPDDPDTLGPDGVLVTCEQLSVAEMRLPTGRDRAMELAASGNVVVKGRTFTARAPRMTYTDAKRLLILDGNGYADAELYHQKYVGAPFSKASARKISYLLDTREVLFAGARSLESN